MTETDVLQGYRESVVGENRGIVTRYSFPSGNGERKSNRLRSITLQAKE